MKSYYGRLSKNICAALALMLIVTALCFSAPRASAAAAAGRIRVGIFYGSNALASANLANEKGSGYRFGFYDSAYTFITLGYTAAEKITMCKDANLYLSGGTYYETPLSSGYKLVGAYHLQTEGTYATYDEALTAAKNYPYGFPACIGGQYVVRFEFYSTAANAEKDMEKYPNTSVVGASTTCYTVVETATGQILFEYDSGGKACLAVMPDAGGAVETQTWFKGYLYYGGFQYNRRNGNDMTVINLVDTDRYVAGVLPYEFVTSGGMESLKAGAVAIRTFAGASTKHQSLGFDVCTTTDCEVYHGVYGGSIGERVTQAAQETSGKCIYYDGKLIQALFSAADGGATESALNAWGNDYPYLLGKVDPYEDSITFNSQSWSYTVTPAQVQSLMKSMGYTCGAVTSMEVTALTNTGNVNQIVITDANGKVLTFKRDNVRILQNISGVTYFSRRFKIEPITDGSTTAVTPAEKESFSVYDGKTTTTLQTIYAITANGTAAVDQPAAVMTESGQQQIGGATQATATTTGGTLTGWKITGRGFGHNVGLSQWGAYAMAAKGYTYEQILKFYYSGVTIN